MPFRALRNATVALATFDSVAAFVACATQRPEAGSLETSRAAESAEAQAAEQLGREDRSPADADK